MINMVRCNKYLMKLCWFEEGTNQHSGSTERTLNFWLPEIFLLTIGMMASCNDDGDKLSLTMPMNWWWWWCRHVVTFMAALILFQPSILSSGGLATYLQYIIITYPGDRAWCADQKWERCSGQLVNKYELVDLPSSSILCNCLTQFAPAGK